MKVCVSIGVYDAFEDLKISTEILKYNWPANLELFLLCGYTQKDSTDLISSNFNKKIFIKTPSTLSSKKIKLPDVLFRHLRVFETFIATGKEAIKNDCDFIIHLSAGSWILKPNKILKLLNKLKNKTFGARIANRAKYLIVDDHFFIVNLRNATKNKIYELNYNDRVYNSLSLSINGIHGILLNWLNSSKVGQVFIYSNLHHSINKNGERPYTFNPLYFDNENFFLHTNKNFSEILDLRKIYIEKFVENKSTFIKNYIKINKNKKTIKFNKNNIPFIPTKIKDENLDYYSKFTDYDEKFLI